VPDLCPPRCRDRAFNSGGTCWWLEPLQQRIAEHVIFASQKLFAVVDTPIPVLESAKVKPFPIWGKTEKNSARADVFRPSKVYIKIKRKAHIPKYASTIYNDPLYSECR
jgi:hypothetical protein